MISKVSRLAVRLYLTAVIAPISLSGFCYADEASSAAPAAAAWGETARIIDSPQWDLPADAAIPVYFFDLQDTPALPLDARPTSKPAVVVPSSQASQPEASSAAAGNFPATGSQYGLGEFVRHFAPHEPVYFVGGWEAPNVKFQFSFRYRIFTPDGPLAVKHPWVKGFNLAYTQISLWDVSKPSAPFFDSSYKPEVFYYLENLPPRALPPGWQLGFQGGVGHESNGKGGVDSRSMNIAFLRPIITIADNRNGLFLTFAPKFYYYIDSLSDNPEMKRYRGYTDMKIVVGQRDGLQLSTIGRVGDHADRGSAQFDLTYPLTKLLHGSMDLSLDAQYFIGYGESLLTYKERSSVFRIGLSLIR